MPITIICEQCGKAFEAPARRVHRQRFCSYACYHAYRPRREHKRFWSYVDKGGPDGCWLWTGGHTGGGYGQFYPYGGPAGPAHRYAYELLVGPIPDGLVLCHRCDNRTCVNPEHLFVGTQQDNMDDCVQKGRRPHGDGCANSRLTSAQVCEIRRLYADGVTQRELAQRFGTHQTNVSMIVRRLTWRHVP